MMRGKQGRVYCSPVYSFDAESLNASGRSRCTIILYWKAKTKRRYNAP
ncbi:hypothetical protein H1P_2220007 [Hyella patelloides LEGE 07179]|uniref:Uncharacterized protein n=1 Tax=Hyella patelloides LEGE 07179 TaxID=945734 RepID=A0A563VR07_9CYAN|nr:hypothetical protein H1P_2220007 [Hyella patelloides LEGE 07179]